MCSPLTTPSPNLGKATAPVSTPSSTVSAAWKLEQNTNLFFYFPKIQCHSQKMKANKTFNKKNVLNPQKRREEHRSVTATAIQHLGT